MRQIDEAVYTAVRHGQSMQRSNTLVIQEDNNARVVLHCNTIAILDRVQSTLKLMTCGYNTKVTRNRLNAIVKAIHDKNCVHIEQGETYVYWYDHNNVKIKQLIDDTNGVTINMNNMRW